MTTSAIRERLYDYIRVADAKKVKAIYVMLEDEITDTVEWWKDNVFIKELDEANAALESGEDKGCSMADINNDLELLEQKRRKLK